MNREIKFRAWDKINKKMVYNVGIGPDGKLSPNAEIYASSWKVNQNALDFFRGIEQLFEEPQQFTGLHDKNGKEIYEGDVLGLNELPIPGKQTSFGQAIVKFGDYSYLGIEYGSDGYGYYVEGYDGYRRSDGRIDKYYFSDTGQETILHCKEWEVIGNVFENPELIDTEKKV